MTGYYTILVGLLPIVIIPGLKASCGSGRFGESCRYYCNCQVECNQVTGSCPGSCNTGWVKGGQLCQKQNFAYKKIATSTTNTRYPDWPPQNAVDGDNNINGASGTCFHGDYGRNELTIDLGIPFKLSRIRFYLRNGFNFRIANSYIYLDNDRSRVCYTFPPTVSNNPTDVVCDAEARYLTIENPGNGSIENTPLSICEVEIYQCSPGTYGVNCTNFCHCSSCDGTTGVCTGDCFAGWKGDQCDIACEATRYGINCVQDCESRHCSSGSSSCDRYTGRCDPGCLPGWKGTDCVQKCDPRYYGQNCSKVCTDRNCYGQSVCDHVTGTCDHGCQQGWTGSDCRQECVDSYGFNCNMTCGDRKCAGDMESCDRYTGSCDPCLSGWEGVDCTKTCDRLHYGLNCGLQCKNRHCTEIDSSCHHLTGLCDQGCLPGWLRDDCTEGCDDTHYGQDCLQECGSRQCNGARDCNRTSGQCLEGCQSGWTGIDCAASSESTTTDVKTIVLSTTVGVLVVIIVTLVVFNIRMRRRQLSSEKTSKETNPDAPGPSSTPDHIYSDVTPGTTNTSNTIDTTSTSTTPAHYESFQMTEENQYTGLKGRNTYENT